MRKSESETPLKFTRHTQDMSCCGWFRLHRFHKYYHKYSHNIRTTTRKKNFVLNPLEKFVCLSCLRLWWMMKRWLSHEWSHRERDHAKCILISFLSFFNNFKQYFKGTFFMLFSSLATAASIGCYFSFHS